MTRALTLAEARVRFPHRFTMEHVPAWAREQRADGTYYAPQYRSDAEWYELTIFPGECGLPKRARHCQSGGQTWPLGTALPGVYVRDPLAAVRDHIARNPDAMDPV